MIPGSRSPGLLGWAGLGWAGLGDRSRNITIFMRCAGAGLELGWTQDMVTTRSVVPSWGSRDLQREGRREAAPQHPVSAALHSFLSKMNRDRCVGSVTPPPPFTLPVHVRYTGHGLIPPLRGGRARPGGGGVARLEAGTTLGLMGRGDTAAGMLATVCGHSVELRWRCGICAVCCESVDTRETLGQCGALTC